MPDNDDSQAKAEQQSTKKLADDVHWITHATFWSQIGLGIIGIIALVIYHGQLEEMRKSTDAATQASQTAKDTLAAMQAGQVSSDVQFGTQLQKLDASIKQADRLASATEKANANAVGADRPWIGGVPVISQFEVGKNITLGFMFTNNGKRPAFVESTKVRFDIYPSFPTVPEYTNPHNEKFSTNFVVPGASFGTIESGDTPLEQPIMDALQKGILTYYLFSEVRYRDALTNDEHITHMCLLFIPRNKSATDQGWRNCPEYNDAN